MIRLYDWLCPHCLGYTEHLVEYPQGGEPPRAILEDCRSCGMHHVLTRRAVNRVASYSPQPIRTLVSGGSMDTAGNGLVTHLPEIPADATPEQVESICTSKEFADAMWQRNEESSRNEAKRKRAAAIRRGENIDLRRDSDRLPGDPPKGDLTQ